VIALAAVKTGLPFTYTLFVAYKVPVDIVLAAIELKFPCKELVMRVLIRLLIYEEEPRPVIEELSELWREAVEMYVDEPRPCIVDCKEAVLIYEADPSPVIEEFMAVWREAVEM